MAILLSKMYFQTQIISETLIWYSCSKILVAEAKITQIFCILVDADVTVIGSGPGGYVAAIKAAQLGFKVRWDLAQVTEYSSRWTWKVFVWYWKTEIVLSRPGPPDAIDLSVIFTLLTQIIETWKWRCEGLLSVALLLTKLPRTACFWLEVVTVVGLYSCGR